MMYSTTFRPRNPASPMLELAAGLIASGFARLQSLGRALILSAPTAPEASAELLRRAEAYEATQPSYAADLRAAAARFDVTAR
ncbi:MAG: hypothetical protein KF788_00535 [Piscinibacter sp.]|nr:hypothetical protein [Piscinibacter sp.]